MLLNPTDSTYPKSAPGLLIYTPINFIENVPLGAKDSFDSKLKKNIELGTRRVLLFLLHQMLSLFSKIKLVYVLQINIFGRDYSNLNNLFPR